MSSHIDELVDAYQRARRQGAAIAVGVQTRSGPYSESEEDAVAQVLVDLDRCCTPEGASWES